MPFDSIAPDRHAARWSELRKAAAMAWLSKCDEPPAEATHAAAKRALGGGRHLPCATYYGYEAERAESMARDCRQRGTASDVLFAERWEGWARFWREREAKTLAGRGYE